MNSNEIRQQINAVQGSLSAAQDIIRQLAIGALDGVRTRPQDVAAHMAEIRMYEIQCDELSRRLHQAENDELLQAIRENVAKQQDLAGPMNELGAQLDALTAQRNQLSIAVGDDLPAAQINAQRMVLQARYNELYSRKNRLSFAYDNLLGDARARGLQVAA